MTTDDQTRFFNCKLDGLVLWRDGSKAVVSVHINNRWIRALEADVTGVFCESCDELAWRNLCIAAGLAKRENTRNQRNRDKAKAKLEAAQ